MLFRANLATQGRSQLCLFRMYKDAAAAREWEHGMPEISRFFGIVVRMYYNDHSPPHFHVRYAGQKAVLGVETLAVLTGRLSPKALALVVEWAALHRNELSENWELGRSNLPLKSIPPLE